MKRAKILLIASAILISSASAGYAAETPAPTRADGVLAIQNQYNPLFDAQYAHLLALKKKTQYDAANAPIVKSVIADFLTVRRSINADLANPAADLETIRAYAEEELGEFNSTLFQLDSQTAKNKTITCVKGKVVKKITSPAPKCAKGYKKK